MNCFFNKYSQQRFSWYIFAFILRSLFSLRWLTNEWFGFRFDAIVIHLPFSSSLLNHIKYLRLWVFRLYIVLWYLSVLARFFCFDFVRVLFERSIHFFFLFLKRLRARPLVCCVLFTCNRSESVFECVWVHFSCLPLPLVLLLVPLSVLVLMLFMILTCFYHYTFQFRYRFDRCNIHSKIFRSLHQHFSFSFIFFISIHSVTLHIANMQMRFNFAVCFIFKSNYYYYTHYHWYLYHILYHMLCILAAILSASNNSLYLLVRFGSIDALSWSTERTPTTTSTETQ